MKLALSLFACLAIAVSSTAQETVDKPDYTELSKLVRGIVLKNVPKEVIAVPAWNLSTPMPAKLRLPGLARQTIQVGDRVELAHGSWKKAKVWMENPERDFSLAVTQLKPLDGSKHRVSLNATAPLLVEYEFQQWLNGLMIVGVSGRAKTKIKVDLDCDVAVSFSAALEVSVEPKVSWMAVDVQELEVFNPNGRGQALNAELKSFVQGMVRTVEPQIQEEANKAIAAALKDGKGTISAAKLFGAVKK